MRWGKAQNMVQEKCTIWVRKTGPFLNKDAGGVESQPIQATWRCCCACSHPTRSRQSPLFGVPLPSPLSPTTHVRLVVSDDELASPVADDKHRENRHDHVGAHTRLKLERCLYVANGLSRGPAKWDGRGGGWCCRRLPLPFREMQTHIDTLALSIRN